MLTVPYRRAMLLGGLHNLLTSFILTRDTSGTPVLWRFTVATFLCYILDADNSITFWSHHLSNTLIHKICCCSRNQASQSVSTGCYYFEFLHFEIGSNEAHWKPALMCNLDSWEDTSEGKKVLLPAIPLLSSFQQSPYSKPSTWYLFP